MFSELNKLGFLVFKSNKEIVNGVIYDVGLELELYRYQGFLYLYHNGSFRIVMQKSKDGVVLASRDVYFSTQAGVLDHFKNIKREYA